MTNSGRYSKRIMNKYGNKKTEVDGIVFDSKLEAERYFELKLMERAGVIRDLQLQPSFELIPAFRKNGKSYRKRSYIADFAYFDIQQGKTIIEDTKGVKTDVYKLKAALFEYLYPNLEIKEITRKDLR